MTFEEMSYHELRSLAKEWSLKVPRGTKHPELLEMISNRDSFGSDENPPKPDKVPAVSEYDMDRMSKDQLLRHLEERFGYTYPHSDAVSATRPEVKQKIRILEKEKAEG